MRSVWQDLRYGLRMLLRKPGFTFAAVLTIALGIGANTAIFSAVNAVLLRPLPYLEPERLVRIWGTSARQSATEARGEFYDYNISPNNFYDWREQNQVFAQMAAFSFGSLTLTGRDEPLRLVCPAVSAEFFSVLGVTPAHGRFFLPEEEQVGQHRAVVLSHGLWHSQFGGDPNIIGQTLSFEGNSFVVVGVAPANFRHPVRSPIGEPDLWRPLALRLEPGNRGGYWLHAIGRLKPGVTLEQAQAEMSAISNRLEQQYPETNAGRGARLSALHHAVVGNVRPALWLLFGAVGLVLLIACANVANLLLARASTRRREMAIRLSLGASFFRVVRQLLTESLLLALIGGAFGLLLALWLTDVFIALGADIPRLEEVSVDTRALGFALGLTLLTGIIFGLAPALNAVKFDLNQSLKEGGLTSSPRRHRSRSLLVVSEVALALMLLVGAGLLLKSFWRLQSVDPGFNPEGALVLDISLPQARYPQRAEAANFYQQLLTRIEALPGTQAAGAVNILPLSGSSSCDSFSIAGHPPMPQGQEPCAEIRASSVSYFRALGIPLLMGRQFTEQDRRDAPPVALINETMARRFFPAADPIGQRINLDGASQPVWREIVGVVADVKHFGLDVEPRPEIYQPLLQAPFRGMTIVARTNADPETLASAVRAEVRALDKDLPIYNLRTMRDLVSSSIAQPRFRTLLLGSFAALALLLAAIGVCGVMFNTVAQRTHEIGIRLALGAGRRDILKLILWQGMSLALMGISVGLGAAFALTSVMRSLLFGVSATDWATFVSAALLLFGIALLACYLPARRATKVDPMEALRYE